MRWSFFSLCVVGLVACGDDSAATGGASAGGAAAGGASSSGGSTSEGGSSQGGSAQGGGPQGGSAACYEDAGPADKTRFVVVGHPFDDAEDPNGSYEVLALSTAGELSQTGHKFHMGRAEERPIVFSPNGELGFAVQNDGSVGVFRLASDGTPTVISASEQGDFYADALRWSPAGP